MKKTILTLVIAIAAVVIAQAQQISVVSPAGVTSIFTDLNLAIKSAEAGSTLYLSGGGFQINDATSINKRLSIIGVGHRIDNDNADGSTTINGRIAFFKGADNSALMGVHLSGNVDIANADGAVNTILVRFCNVEGIQVGHTNCQNILINQNYIRNNSNIRNSAITFTNNILHSIQNVNGGVIDHNVIRHNILERFNIYSYYRALFSVSNSQIKNNVLVDPGHELHSGDNCTISNNMLTRSWGDNCVVVESWDDVFEGTYSGININDNYRLKGTQGKNAAIDGTDIGIYGGTGFSNTALPPIPRITLNRTDEQTDEQGKLTVRVRVSAQ